MVTMSDLKERHKRWAITDARRTHKVSTSGSYETFRISHEEGTCPELTEELREKNRLARIDEKEMEERATREAFSVPSRYGAERRRAADRRSPPALRYGGEESSDSRGYYRRAPNYKNEVASRKDLREKITENRDSRDRNVWNRLDNPSESNYPRDRVRFHPYQPRRTIDYTAKDARGFNRDRSGSRTNSAIPNWIPKDRDSRIHPTEAQSYNRTSNRRGSPDSQRTVTADYEVQREKRYSRDLGRLSPRRINMEWRPVRERQGEEVKKTSEVSEKGEGETEEERRRILKGKAIAIVPSPDKTEKKRYLLNRETLEIREQGIDAARSKIQRSPPPVIEKNRVEESPERVLEKANESGASGEDIETIPSDEDDEAFEKLVDHYSEPAPEGPAGDNDIDMDDVDDLRDAELEWNNKDSKGKVV
ncbi:hypothetical protein Bca101_057135 [Brassica carinata]